jgi:hypothetical protein
MAAKDMPTFKALSYSEKWRVNRVVARGEAPTDPRMAAAAVELAESCQHTSPALHRGLAIVLILGSVALAILAAANGHGLVTISMVLVALTHIGQMIFNPRLRPQNVSRSLEASQRVLAAGS